MLGTRTAVPPNVQITVICVIPGDPWPPLTNTLLSPVVSSVPNLSIEVHIHKWIF